VALVEYLIAWVSLAKYFDLTGDTKDAMQARCESGRWLRGREYKNLDGALWVNLAAVDCWANSVSVSTTEQQVQQECSSAPDSARADDLTKTIEKVANALEALSAVAMIPLQYDSWDVDHIARYMKRSADTVRREIVVQPSFPKPMRIPGAGRSHALWKAREVVAWLESH
jgi:hypothetical protein